MRKHKEAPVKRTSVPLPPDLVRRAKAVAALEGKTLAQIIAEALELRLKEKKR